MVVGEWPSPERARDGIRRPYDYRGQKEFFAELSLNKNSAVCRLAVVGVVNESGESAGETVPLGPAVNLAKTVSIGIELFHFMLWNIASLE